MGAIIVILLMVEFYIILSFIYLITRMKKPELKLFYKLYDFWSIIIFSFILIVALGFMTVYPSKLKAPTPTFSIEISRDNEFEIIEVLDELSNKRKKNQEVYIDEHITITYNDINQIANIQMGVFIPKNSGYMYYSSDLDGNKLVFRQVREDTGDLTIDYCKALIEEYHSYIENIDSKKINYYFENTGYSYWDASGSYILDNNELTKIDNNYVLPSDSLVVHEWNKVFGGYDLS